MGSGAIIVSVPPSSSSLGVLNSGNPQRYKSPPLVISTDDKKLKYTFPYGPKEFSYTGSAPTYTQVARPGRPPLLLLSAPGLPVMTFTLQLAYPDRQKSIQFWINQLQALASSQSHIQVAYGSISAGLWRITSLTINGTDRNLQNEVSRATVDIEFTRSSDASINVGPVSGGVKKPPAKAAVPVRKTTTSATSAKRAPFIYTVKSGDTLWSICQSHYGDASKWRAVADYNKIPNPNRIVSGQKLTLP